MVLKKEITLQIKDLLKENPQGLSITDIVRVVNINRNTAGRYLENLLVSGQVEMRRLGMAKIYLLSQRVPLSALLSISSELVIQLDSSLRITFANEPFLKLVGTDSKTLLGKNIEYTPVALVFDEIFPGFIENIKQGINGTEWSGEIALSTKDTSLFCRIAPTVFEDGRKGVSVIFEDITQRKQGERKIEESERQFRLLAENSLDMIGRIKPDSTHTYVSPAYTSTLGYLPEEVIGKNGLLFIHPEDIHIMEAVRNILTPQYSSATIRFRLRHKDGHYIWLESHIKAIFDEKTHDLSEYYTVTRDITERKEAETTLRESEERYRKLVEISPNAVFQHQEGKILFANSAMLKLLGATHPDEIIGKYVLDFVSAGFKEIVRKNIQTDLEGQTSPVTELSMIRIDGTPILVEGRGVKTTINGKPAIQVAIRDITESKRAEAALRESEETFRSLVQESSDGIVITNEEGRVIVWNDALTQISGIPRDEALGKFYVDLMVSTLVPEHREDTRIMKIRKIINEQFQTGVSSYFFRPLEAEIIRRDGERRYIQQTAFPIQTAQGYRIGSIIRDITERKHAEIALGESEEKYRTLVDRANDVICIIQDEVIKMCNPRLPEFWGGSIEEIIGKPISGFIHPDALPEVIDRYNRRMAGDSPPSIYETILMRKDGSRSYVELNAGIISYEGKKADLVIIRDINERKKAEQALRESEATARALLNAPTDSVILIDDHGIILALNEIAASRFGRQSDELVGILSYDLLPKDVAQLRRTLMVPVLEKREMVRFSDERDGRWYDTVAYPIINQTGDVKKIAIIARDVTEQKNIEKRLYKSEQMYKRLLEQSFDAIAIHKGGKIAYLNERAAKILGAARPEDLVGRPIFDFIHPESRRDLEDRVRELGDAEGMSAPVITEKFFRTDGSTITVEVMAISFDDNGIPAFRVAFREISPP